jgi:LuxR family maltose regulon positive regulatory protein
VTAPVRAGLPWALLPDQAERPFQLLESKLHPPVARPGMVARTALLDRLIGAGVPPVISVVAPAGYGKTTLLAQWAELKQPRLAWVSADAGDNDPAVLLTYLAVALDRVEPIRPAVFHALASPGAGQSVVPALVSAVSSMRRPVSIVVDHVDAVTNRECLDAIAELALAVPPGSQFAIGSRNIVPLPTARLRAEGSIVEVGAHELAMGDAEASSLLAAAGTELGGEETHDLVERTEGWPAGLYLAALAMNAGSPPAEAVFSFTGDDRYMSDYLRAEFLDRVSRAEVSFLTRTSILDRLSGPLCDATLDIEGSGRVLEQLDLHNLLVVPLDRNREWYRYHQLFRQLLYAELTRREPGLIPTLHSRAASWLEAKGRPATAIEHAQAAGDAERVARLVLTWMQPVWASGRVDTVLSWMEWLEDKTWVQNYAAIAVHGALILALLGRPGAAERWAAAAEQAASPGNNLPDGDTTDGLLAYLRALLCRHGIAEMRRDAQNSWERLSPASPFRATMLHTEGVSYLLEADPGRGGPILAHAFDAAVAAGAAPLVALILVERAIASAEGADWTGAQAFTEQALTIVREGHFDDYWTSALVYAWAARNAAHQGDLAQARQHAAHAARLRPLLTYALPAVSAQALLELARAYLALGDPSGVRAVLRQTRDILEQRPDLGILPQQAEELQAKLATVTEGTSGASSLTTAELRLLPLLSTHLTLEEIGERLYVSRNTVKTQAISVYRKFGVSTRREAIARMHELGLLSHD